MEGLIIPAAVVVIASLLFMLFKLLRVGRRPKDYSPGPPTIPVLGNLHLMPTKYGHRQFQKWSQEYGPIYSLILGTRTYIILSSDTCVKELLDRRSAIYSSRPDMYMAHDIASGGLRFLTMIYGHRWRTVHKMIHNILNLKAAVTYVPYQDLENKQLLVGLLDEPEEFVDHLRRYSNSLSTQMIFGYRTPSKEDPDLKQLFEAGFEQWGEIVGSASAQILDMYPILRKFPKFLASNYRHAEDLHIREKKLYVGHWLKVKEALLNRTGKPCFCNDLLKAQETEKFSDDQAGYISGSLLEAGSDTTSAILIGFVQAMMVFPDVQKRAQEEMDRVVGPNQLPTMDDEPNLQYIRGCVKESLRWMPTAILGVPHCVTKDNEYMGYKIPEGAAIISNVGAIHMDPKRNPNPRTFDPDRYANDFQTEFESATNADVSKRGNFVFGAGRRLCQGMHIAERSLFLGISRMVWAFNFNKPLDAAGNPIMPDIDDLVGGLTVHPAPFKVLITPRSEEKVKIMRREWKECTDTLLDEKTKQWKEVPKGMAFSTYVPEKINI